ncbi:MAG: hypothetical protein ACHQ06_05540 [Candidatus Dormibacteria bacterium]
MPTPSRITMLRELSAAGDRERTGALDVEWNGTRASLFFTFGQANHAELERADGRKLVGSDALSAIAEELPDDFRVAPWRRTKSAGDTLRCTTEELMFLFRRDPATTAGRGPAKAKTATKRKSKAAVRAADAKPAVAPVQPAQPAASIAAAAAAFDLPELTPLPLGKALFSDAASSIQGIDRAVPQLPDCLIVLTAPHHRGAVLVAGGAIADAIWVDRTDRLVKAHAARAIFGARDGNVAAYSIDDPRLVTALSTLWHAPRLCAAVPGRTVNVDGFVAGAHAAGHTCALVVTASADPGVALFTNGELVAVYTAGRPAPVTTKAALGRLLRAAGAQVTLLGVDSDADAGPNVGGIAFPRLGAAHRVAAARQPAVFRLPDAGRTPDAEGATTEFVPTRVDIDIDGLRAELIGIADAWLGKDDVAPVATAIRNARPGVDDFVAAIQAISSLDIPGHENAVVRAMAREMHFRAAEVLCGV